MCGEALVSMEGLRTGGKVRGEVEAGVEAAGVEDGSGRAAWGGGEGGAILDLLSIFP